MCKSFKSLREHKSNLQSKNDPIYIGIFVFVSMILLNLFFPKIENFWLDIFIKGGIIGVIGIFAMSLLFKYRARKRKKKELKLPDNPSM